MNPASLPDSDTLNITIELFYFAKDYTVIINIDAEDINRLLEIHAMRGKNHPIRGQGYDAAVKDAILIAHTRLSAIKKSQEKTRATKPPSEAAVKKAQARLEKLEKQAKRSREILERAGKCSTSQQSPELPTSSTLPSSESAEIGAATDTEQSQPAEVASATPQNPSPTSPDACSSPAKEHSESAEPTIIDDTSKTSSVPGSASKGGTSSSTSKPSKKR